MLQVIIGVPVLLVLVLFALSNTEPVAIGIWPTDYTIQAPFSIAVMAGAAIAFLLGGLIVWVGELGQRRRARRAEEHVRVLEEQVQELKAKLPRMLASPP